MLEKNEERRPFCISHATEVVLPRDELLLPGELATARSRLMKELRREETGRSSGLVEKDGILTSDTLRYSAEVRELRAASVVGDF